MINTLLTLCGISYDYVHITVGVYIFSRKILDACTNVFL